MINFDKVKLSLLVGHLKAKTQLVPGLSPICKPIFNAGSSICDFLQGAINSRKSPIYIVGLARSGTTWIASIINTAHSIKYFHEPFNCKNVPGASRYCMKYLISDADVEFVHRCHDAFSGRMSEDSVRGMLSNTYKQHPWWPGRVVIKDVCSCMAVEAIHRSVAPITIIVVRHPCAVAASWYRLQYDVDLHMQTLLEQPQLCDEFLRPFQSTLKNARGFWQKLGALWGVVYYSLLQQSKAHTDWLMVRHEDLCVNPIEKFQSLFQTLDLDWTRKTEDMLRVSTQTHSHEPYLVHRVSNQEPDKWKGILDNIQIEQVLDFVRPFDLSLYAD